MEENKGLCYSDGDLLSAMEVMVDYGPVVYGYCGHYYNSTLYMTKDGLTEGEYETIDGEQGKIWLDNLNENNVETDKSKHLKESVHLYYY